MLNMVCWNLQLGNLNFVCILISLDYNRFTSLMPAHLIVFQFDFGDLLLNPIILINCFEVEV